MKDIVERLKMEAWSIDAASGMAAAKTVEWDATAGLFRRSRPEIGEYMGHTDLNTTRKHYARFHPDHLRKASKSLEIV